jgi:CheY-like chemotaxis protein
MNHPRPLLIVEDSDEDYEVTCWTLRQAGLTRPIVRASRAEDALLHLRLERMPEDGIDRRPCLALLDLNLPGMNGQQLLEELRQNEPSSEIPIVILSSSKNPHDVDDCYRLGAAGYLCKPLSLDLYIAKMREFTGYWFDAVMLAEKPATVYR